MVATVETQHLMAGSDSLTVGNPWDGSKPIETRYTNKLWDDEDEDDLLDF